MVARDVNANDSDIRGDVDGGYEDVVEGKDSGKTERWM